MKPIKLVLILGLFAAMPLLQGCEDPEDNPLLRFAWLPALVPTAANTTSAAGGAGAATPGVASSAVYGSGAALATAGAGGNAVAIPGIF